jgi:hypothetical protein
MISSLYFRKSNNFFELILEYNSSEIILLLNVYSVYLLINESGIVYKLLKLRKRNALCSICRSTLPGCYTLWRAFLINMDK